MRELNFTLAGVEVSLECKRTMLECNMYSMLYMTLGQTLVLLHSHSLECTCPLEITFAFRPTLACSHSLELEWTWACHSSVESVLEWISGFMFLKFLIVKHLRVIIHAWVHKLTNTRVHSSSLELSWYFSPRRCFCETLADQHSLVLECQVLLTRVLVITRVVLVFSC